MIEINSDIPTPYYVIDKKELDENIEKLKMALKKNWNNYIIGYSYKTNSLQWIIDYFNHQDCFAEVVSDDEYNLSQSIGVPKDKVIYNGIIKSKDTFLKAVRDHAIVNIDSQYEIEWLDELPKNQKFEVGVRVNFDLESYCPGQSQCGEEGGRFGFCYENGELKKAIELIESKKVKVTGIHLHSSSKTRSLDIYRAISEVAVEIAKKCRLELKYIDIGGGFFGGLLNVPTFDSYMSLISSILTTYFKVNETKLVVEPGMSLIGPPVSYITTVIDIKETISNRFVITDGSRVNIDPLMTKSGYFHQVFRKETGRKKIAKQVISGFTCMEHDRLFVMKDEEELKRGDKISYQKVGAYTMCLTPLFIKYFPGVFVAENEELRQIREPWTYFEYKQKSRGI